jgi:hypothetical protein
LNFTKYQECLEGYAKFHQVNPNFSFQIVHEMIVRVNAALLNFLGAMRTFLDHTETRLKRRYGNESIEVSTFKANASRAYDNSFAYRFLYKLRNFAQHCGMPMGYIQANATITDPQSKTTENRIDFLIDRDQILRAFDQWSAPLREEIVAQPDRFHVAPLVNEMMEHLRAIHTATVRCEIGDIRCQTAGLASLIAETAGHTGAPALLKRAEITFVHGTNTPKIDFDFERLQVDPLSELEGLISELLRHTHTPTSSYERYRVGWNRVFA